VATRTVQADAAAGNAQTIRKWCSGFDMSLRILCVSVSTQHYRPSRSVNLMRGDRSEAQRRCYQGLQLSCAASHIRRFDACWWLATARGWQTVVAIADEPFRAPRNDLHSVLIVGRGLIAPSVAAASCCKLPVHFVCLTCEKQLSGAERDLFAS